MTPAVADPIVDTVYITVDWEGEEFDGEGSGYDDVDLDLDDYAAFQAAFTGPTAPNNNPNGPG